MVYEVHVTLNRKFYSSIVVTALLSSDGNEYASGRVPFQDVGTKVIQLKVRFSRDVDDRTQAVPLSPYYYPRHNIVDFKIHFHSV